MAYKHWHTYSPSGDEFFQIKPLHHLMWMMLFLDIVVVHKQQQNLLCKVLKLASYFSKSHLKHHIRAQKRGTALTTVIQTNSNIQMESYIYRRYLQCICFPGKGFSDQLITSHTPVLGGAKKTDWPNWPQAAGMPTFTMVIVSLQFQTSLHLWTHCTPWVERVTRNRVLWPPPGL